MGPSGARLKHMGSTRNSPSAWREAQTAEDLCACALGFLAGELLSFPGWGAPNLDEESDTLVPTLKRCCQAGFLTVASQPAGTELPGADGRMERRRAFVTGFASTHALEHMGRELPDGLVLFAHESSMLDLECGMVVGERGDDAFLLAGGAAGPLELDFFREESTVQAAQDLASWSFVSLIDENWNRDDRLWSHLDRVLAP